MPQPLDTAVVATTPDDLEQFLGIVEEENAAEGSRRVRRELVFGLLAIPVLFAGLVAAIVWVVPVIADRLPLVFDVISLTQLG